MSEDVRSDLERPVRQRRKMQSVTMTDVADYAKVSPSTVSLYLRRPEAVSASAGSAIARAIDKLNYVPNLVAGGLAAASSRAVSIIVPSVRNAFFAETVAAMQTALRKERLQVILGHTEYDEREEEDLVRTALSWAPAAIVVTGLSHSETTRRMLGNAKVPVIEIWELGGPQIDAAIGFHHDQVGAAAARHLLQQGRRHLAFLGARMHEDRRAKLRCDGFMATARDAGVVAEVVQHPDASSADVGAMLLSETMQQLPQTDGIACSNDHVALGVLFECQRMSIAVPERLATIGFGDLSFSAACNPPLSTIRPSGDLIGREAARLILEQLAGRAPQPQTMIDTRFTLLHRRSS
ncbi:LacI family DNA-binding transcriptional regulator [Rhizobium sp. SSA_523]|uniref:LacI family DNA-binding transcriptional regulator n=1 Tax=Rhizobium sp. SSA_523 TaxID=2952477 RepID=UPI00209120C5|nr:LacI family DNA-binding transcriptional regulator [Rhizobium sp. SSA_523]MCO5732535.1 LacI family DNA-binding transcriptional regulator [Rhizobium sp. SSA_523]WKC22326.1 LacI family DNA-binding transcriptional regulator [Rhizobium sp. SSA_523]